MIARQTIFEGRVQGVGFRYTCKELAKGYDLTGSVENLPEGTVKLILQGEEEEIEEYLQDLSEESALSHHIKGQMTTPIEVDDSLKGFVISK
ncbi:acylphosphatase [Roseibacillus persicicus]|uniref:acylphosphatase n=1 Tax=Roseibacillus persicicus TaxID=454148 RepID=UPI00398AD4DF